MAIGTKKVRKNGKTYSYPRNYKVEYSERTPQQKANRSVRRQARAKMEAKHGKAALKGKDVDHIRGIGGGSGGGYSGGGGSFGGGGASGSW